MAEVVLVVHRDTTTHRAEVVEAEVLVAVLVEVVKHRSHSLASREMEEMVQYQAREAVEVEVSTYLELEETEEQERRVG
jgi:hypothetical protein